jgi:hypothetical protein
MGLGSVVWSLLLGVALGVGCASAAEIAARADRAGSSALSQPNGTAVSGKQKLRRVRTSGPEAKDNKEKAGSAAERKGEGEAGGSVSQGNPAVEPPHVALRGVRG